MHPPALLHGQLGWDRHARQPDDRQLARIRRTAWEKQEGRTFGARPAARDDLPTGPAAAPTITTPRHAHDEAVGALLHPLVLPLSTSAAAHWYIWRRWTAGHWEEAARHAGVAAAAATRTFAGRGGIRARGWSADGPQPRLPDVHLDVDTDAGRALPPCAVCGLSSSSGGRASARLSKKTLTLSHCRRLIPPGRPSTLGLACSGHASEGLVHNHPSDYTKIQSRILQYHPAHHASPVRETAAHLMATSGVHSVNPLATAKPQARRLPRHGAYGQPSATCKHRSHHRLWLARSS